MRPDEHQAAAKKLIPAVSELRRRALELEETHRSDLHLVAPEYLPSARNLIHYLALRQTDIRPLQRELVMLGLTSLGNMENAVLCTLDTVLYDLHVLSGEPYESPTDDPPVDYSTGPLLLEEHTEELLGQPAGKRRVRIMVTMPTEAAADGRLIYNLLAAGMDAMRINCAHDDKDAWLKMIRNLRQAERELGRPCKIYADLAGPKLRTGPIRSVGKIVRYRPTRNYRGEVVDPCHVWLTPAHDERLAPDGADVTLPIEPGLLPAAEAGDEIHLVDARGRRRQLTVLVVQDGSCLAETDRTHYAETGMPVQLVRDGEPIAESTIGELPDLVLPIPLQRGDTLVLTRAAIPGEPAAYDEAATLLRPAHISCTLKEAFDSVLPGHRVLFDDGTIQGYVKTNDHEEMVIEITHTGLKGANLRAEKGVNFPDTTLTMPSLTAKDLDDLEFMVRHVDIVGLSFVRTQKDVFALEQQLQRLNALDVGVVLKIETRQAFENLALLLAAAMRTPPDGVMVARGDLAAEIGFERMAEAQEEILWFCEAAHIPVIWATQVLESLAKRGSPSRAEVTDVVMSGRAECVMLNKGPYIVETVRFLSGVLERMSTHRAKRRTMLRKLAISQMA